MSQEEFTLFGNVAGGFHKLLQAILFLVMWDIFFRPARERRTLFLAGAFAAASVLLYACPLIPGWARYVICAVAVLGYCRFKCRACMEKAVFILLLFFHFHGMSYLIAGSIYQVWADAVLNGWDVSDTGYMEHVYQTLCVGQVCILVLYLLTFIVMTWILKRIVKSPISMRWQDVVFLSVLNVVGSMLTWIVMDLTAVPMEQEVFSFLPKDGKWSGRSRCWQCCFLRERSRLSVFSKDTRRCRMKRKNGLWKNSR